MWVEELVTQPSTGALAVVWFNCRYAYFSIALLTPSPVLAATRLVIAVFSAVLTFSGSSVEIAFCNGLRRRRTSLAAFVCSVYAFITSACASARRTWVFNTAMR